ncbi:61adf098-273b-4804-a3f7-b45ae9bded2c [Sclerotinia trifoliorum]|uniref:61adf098-273b-4804-a3f7-b45ae9bded2c n=1 Tax=Sclerotinia trifoliorum TaxID=28548 RepID=A0A8H2VYL4_9HELO|nr:61adf098-273b-4804-a3f7-b45ae9bded2c [Sclerotinia trifoliorum]
MMSSRPLKSQFERKYPKSNQFPHSAISLSNKPFQTGEKPLPPIPKALNGAIQRILLRRRDSIALPRVMGSLNRGMERVRRHSLVASVEPGISVEKNDVDNEEHYAKDEEAEIGIVIKMTIVSVRARLIYIGCKRLDS